MKCAVMLKLLMIRARLGHFGPKALVKDVMSTLTVEQKEVS